MEHPSPFHKKKKKKKFTLSDSSFVLMCSPKFYQYCRAACNHLSGLYCLVHDLLHLTVPTIHSLFILPSIIKKLSDVRYLSEH